MKLNPFKKNNNQIYYTENREEFIEKNKNFIYRCAFKVCKRKLSWENDDELSIALISFNKACDTYKEDKGNFFSYASLLIRNTLIDYFRTQRNTPYLIFDDEDNKKDFIDTKISLDSYEIERENTHRAEEIQLFSEDLYKYGVNFSSLIKLSPTHINTRNNLLNLANKCASNDTIMNYIISKKKLPINQIVLMTNSKRKYFDKWRKYLITLIVLIHSDNYPYIKSYLNIKVGDSNEN